MPKITRTFVAGRMNKVTDERLLPEGEYIDAMNVRMGSTELSEIGVIENTKGNTQLTALTYIDGTPLSPDAKCIGAYEDGEANTLYWFVHDPDFTVGATGKLDLIISYNVFTLVVTYHVVSIDDGGGVNTTLNFNPDYLITGISLIKTGTINENLLFFTDDLNPPRVINLTRGYPLPIANIDNSILGEQLLVIKKPPVSSPSIQMLKLNGQENYMETRFLCFAYRYRYSDNEYSAISQFTAPAFIPNPFEFSINSFLNEGMVNESNGVNITFNTGSSLVKGIDLLFKEADSNIIKVIEKLDKAQSGYVDNANYSYQFSNSKIFTILPDSEILRLYDNVPLQAKAQTIMGNRLMYGNYVEGYDLVDDDGNDVKFEYLASLNTELVGDSVIPDSTATGTYTIDGSQSVAGSVLQIDLTGTNLVAGAALSIEITFTHTLFTNNTPAQETDNVSISFTYFLPRDYTSVFDLASSTEFQDAVGTATNIQPMATACDGITFTDTFNCSVPSSLDVYAKYGSGISAIGQPITVITSPSSSTIGFQLPAVVFVDDLTTPTLFAYEYYEINFAEVTYQEIANPSSLHSNRGYEIGIVYMDEFNRSSTALVSNTNTVFIPCGNSSTRNTIQVSIPQTQLPPYWATRYKFVIKPDATDYETIYSSIFFQDPNTNNAYFLLEGENARKVVSGSRLIVKRDSDGSTQNCVYATVLAKETQPENFLTIPSTLYPGVDIPVPGGVYMKINPTSFNAITDENAIIAPGTVTVNQDDGGEYPLLRYIMNKLNPSTGQYEDYDVPAGSRISLKFEFIRKGKRDGTGRCEKRTYTVDTTLVASANYDNMMDWWNGDNVGLVVENGVGISGADCTPDAEYINTMASGPNDIPTALCTNYFRWWRDPGNQRLFLMMTGTVACTWLGDKENKRSSIKATVEVFRANTLMVFETEPLDANPDIFYENNLSLPIVGGFHTGNIQNQTALVPAIVNTEFFNCYCFGNGVESYKIRDSIITSTFNLGNRVTAVSDTSYKRVDRFADIAYGGVYFDESNVNRLNEFNLGLLNFKQCEDSFGPIQLLDGRETDVLTLQEDKISYVLAGKNLLSDAGGGSSLTSVPEVLGTQIARVEKFGISNNPESYVNWGYDRYFTDIKRGAVIQIKGNSYSSDQLRVISEQGMRTWFRDTFIASKDTQKLGGYDPYMNEYVLSTNDIQLPQPVQCLACGVSQTLNINNTTSEYCVSLGAFIGNVDIEYIVISKDLPSDYFYVDATYNAVTYASGIQTTSGVLTFNKSLNNVNVVDISIQVVGNIVLSVNVSCPNQVLLGVVEVVLTNDADSGKTIHTQYRYKNGTYTSPLQTSYVTFTSGTSNPLSSYYNITTGPQGFGSIPLSGSDVYMYTNKIPPDTFDFDVANSSFKYLTSNTLYDNTSVDLATMLSLATNVTPIVQSGNVFEGSFTAPVLQDYLYLIWDLTAAEPVDLCYSNVDEQDACCACTTTSTYYINGPSLSTAVSVFTDASMTICAADGFYTDGVIVREMLGCVLLPQQLCPSCAQPCPVPSISGGGQAYYILDVDLGSSTGAIVVQFDPNNGPNGLIAEYNGLYYTSVSSELFGYLASGAPNEPVYLGDTPFDCGLIVGSPFINIPILYWDGATNWTPSPNTTTVTVVPAQKQLTAGSPGNCYMVIPKTTATPSNMRVIVTSPCPMIGVFDIDVLCPAPLTSFASSPVHTNSNLACAAGVTQTYYVNHVNGAAGVLDLYDMVYFDVNGQFPLTDGYYHAPSALPVGNQWFKVENGIVVLYNACTYGTNYLLARCHTGTQFVASYAGPIIPLGTFVAVAAVAPCCVTVIAYTSFTATEVITGIPMGATCADCCANYDGVNSTGGLVTVNYDDCSGAPQSVVLNPGDPFNECCRIGSVTSTPTIVISATTCCP
jgi:hypothetical protein